MAETRRRDNVAQRLAREDRLAEVRELLNSGMSMSEVARRFGIARHLVRRDCAEIKRRDRWEREKARNGQSR